MLEALNARFGGWWAFLRRRRRMAAAVALVALAVLLRRRIVRYLIAEVWHLRPATHGFQSCKCLVPMRDGVKLAGTLYLPHKNANEPDGLYLPTVLIRTP